MEQFEKFIITKQGVNFRTSPDSSTKTNIISFVSKDSILQVLENVEGLTWYKVVLLSTGQVGYMSSKEIYVGEYRFPWQDKVEAVVNKIETYLGAPYQFGSSRYTDTTFDCSDLVQWGYIKATGIDLPDDSRRQSEVGLQVSPEQLRTGDALFYDTNRDGVINHVSIFVYPNKIIHTYSTKCDIWNSDLVKIYDDNRGGVTYSLYSGYDESLYKPRPVVIRRYIDDNGNSYL